MKIDKAWQMCVMDWDSVDFLYSKVPEFKDLMEKERRSSMFQDGMVVFIVTSVLKPFSSFSQSFSCLRNVPRFRFMGGVMFSYVWAPNIPTANTYGWVMNAALHPILSEKDALEMEMKFGIDLKEWTNGNGSKEQ